MLDPSFSLRFGFLRPLLWGCLQHFPCKPAGLPNSRSLWQLGWIYIHTYPYHESCVYMYIDIYIISYFCKYVGLEAFPPCSIQQNLLLSYFPKLNKLQKKDLTTTNWTQAPRSDRIFHLPSEWGWGGGVSRCVSHMNHELGTAFFGVLQHAVFKVPTFAAGGWKRGLDLWQNLRRFVFQWSLWPQAGIAQLQLLDLGISNAGTFWTTFFWGGLFRSVKALLPRQWHVESGPWACWNSGHLESLGTFWCSVRWCFWLIVASTRDKADCLVCKCIIRVYTSVCYTTLFYLWRLTQAILWSREKNE